MPIQDAVNHFQSSQAEAMEWLKHELVGLRSGRVKPDSVENIQVDSYGTRSPLKSLASVSSSDARTLVVSPWDKNLIVSIEKAITEANLGVNPTVDGSIIRLVFPSLTEEVRQKTLKVLHSKAEEARIRLRQGRDEALKLIKTEKEAGDLTEDDFYNGRERLDKQIDAANEQVATIVKAKEQEIMTI